MCSKPIDKTKRIVKYPENEVEKKERYILEEREQILSSRKPNL